MIRRKLRMLILILIEFAHRLCQPIRVEDTEKTLRKIINEKKSISRFGDGEFRLIYGEDIKYQKYNPSLSLKMKNILSDEGRNSDCLIAIPYALYSLKSFTFSSKWFWIKYFAQFRDKIQILLSKDVHYYDSQISRIYINRMNKNLTEYYFSLWKKIWDGRDILLIEGKLSRFGVGNTLLDNAKSVKRVLCPSEHAYDKYDEIYEYIINYKQKDLILVSLGPTATVLAYELSQKGLWVIDIGNMDMEYEWMLRRSKKKVAIKNKYSFEVGGGTDVLECDDSKYLSQIITEIG